MNKLIALLLFTISFGTSNAQLKNPFFWTIECSEGKVSYLLGSIHLGTDEMYPLPEHIINSFNNSDVLALEINLNDVNLFSLMQKAMFQDGRTLENSVSAEHFKYFEEEFVKLGMSRVYYNKFKPWFAALFISSLSMQEKGATKTQGIDMYFLNLANEKEMPIAQLESLESQIDIFDSMSDELTDYYLDYILRNNKVASDGAEDLFMAYIEGNDEVILNILNSDFHTNDENMSIIRDKFIVNRNIDMANTIEQMHNSELTHFIVAGAAHFLGDDGIIEILSRTGTYKIKRN